MNFRAHSELVKRAETAGRLGHAKTDAAIDVFRVLRLLETRFQNVLFEIA